MKNDAAVTVECRWGATLHFAPPLFPSSHRHEPFETHFPRFPPRLRPSHASGLKSEVGNRKTLLEIPCILYFREFYLGLISRPLAKAGVRGPRVVRNLNRAV